MSKILSTQQLIELYSGMHRRYVHMSKVSTGAITLHAQPQTLAFGANCSGRPDGLWIARGSQWLNFVTVTQDPDYNKYQYLYDVSINPAKILPITRENYQEFDALAQDYWLNFDYFNVNVTDRQTGKTYRARGTLKMDFRAMKKRSGDTLMYILAQNGVIFLEQQAAKANCTFFSGMTDTEMEKFKYKNWAQLSEQYDGIYFPDYAADHPLMKYLWYQSIDIPSGCIWNPTDVTMNLAYKRTGGNWRAIVKQSS